MTRTFWVTLHFSGEEKVFRTLIRAEAPFIAAVCAINWARRHGHPVVRVETEPDDSGAGGAWNAGEESR